MTWWFGGAGLLSGCASLLLLLPLAKSNKNDDRFPWFGENHKQSSFSLGNPSFEGLWKEHRNLPSMVNQFLLIHWQWNVSRDYLQSGYTGVTVESWVGVCNACSDVLVRVITSRNLIYRSYAVTVMSTLRPSPTKLVWRCWWCATIVPLK